MPSQLAEARRLGRIGEPAAALALARAVAETSTDKQERIAALLRVAWHHLQLGEANLGLAAATAARDLAQELGNPDRKAAALSLSGWLLLEIGLTDEAYVEADESLRLAEAHGEPLTLAHAHNIKGTSLLYSQHPGLAEQHFRKAVALAAGTGDSSAVSLFLSNLAYAFADLADECERAGDPAGAAARRDLAIDIGIRAVDTARLSGDGWMLRLAMTNTTEYLANHGHLDMARMLLAEWPATPGTPGDRETVHRLYTDGELSMLEGDLEAATFACSEALELAEATSHTDHQMNCLSRLAEIAERAGEPETALQLFKRYHDTYRRNEGEVGRRRAQAAEIHFESQRHRAEAERLAAEVLRDPLTGIANRRAFEQRLATLRGTNYAVAIFDIDHFKAINDNHSHMLGDEVLKHLAAMLEAACTPSMLVARLGGEEFALVFAEATTDAHALCDAIRQAIEDFPWSELAPGLNVTVSGGLATASPGEATDAVLVRADNRLYAAKTGGRNRVIAHDAMAPQANAAS